MVTTDLKGVYICDMAIAKLRAASEAKGHLSLHGTRTHRHGAAVDVYAFGCLMIELFGQRKVWGEFSRAQIMQKVCGSFGIAPVAPAVAPHYQSMCKSCCEIDATKWPSITVVMRMLKAYSF